MAKRLEKSIEDSFVKWIKKHYKSYLAIKLNLFGLNGLPDRLIIGPNKFVLFIEFKRPGEVAEPLQDYWHRKLKGWGFNVCVCDNTEKAIEIFTSAIHS